MPEFNSIDCVLFDLGNTLVPFTPRESMEFVVKWYQASGMEDFGIDLQDFLEAYRDIVREERRRMLEEKWETTVEIRSERIIERLSEEGRDVSNALGAMVDTHSGCFSSCLRMGKSSRYVLDILSSSTNENRSPLKMGLISNAGDPVAIMSFLEREQLLGYFQEVTISGEIGYAKPHGEIFLTTLKRMDAEPGRSVYVGDRYDADYMGSRSAGMKPVYIRQYRTAGEPPEGIESIEPRIDHLLDLIPLLEEGSEHWS